MELVQKGVLCTLHRVYQKYGDISAVAVAIARVVASLSIYTEFHADIFAAGKLVSSSELTENTMTSVAVNLP